MRWFRPLLRLRRPDVEERSHGAAYIPIFPFRRTSGKPDVAGNDDRPGKLRPRANEEVLTVRNILKGHQGRFPGDGPLPRPVDELVKQGFNGPRDFPEPRRRIFPENSGSGDVVAAKGEKEFRSKLLFQIHRRLEVHVAVDVDPFYRFRLGFSDSFFNHSEVFGDRLSE